MLRKRLFFSIITSAQIWLRLFSHTEAQRALGSVLVVPGAVSCRNAGDG